MRSSFDRTMLALAAAPAVLAVLLVLRPAFVTDVWPFPGTTELTFIFLASILAAAAASTAWAALFGERISYVGIACLLPGSIGGADADDQHRGVGIVADHFSLVRDRGVARFAAGVTWLGE